MDINGLNKSSVTELFSKLTSQLQVGGNAFAGLLSRVGVDGLLNKASPLGGQGNPVENNAVKAQSADPSSNNTKKTSFAEKNKDVRKADVKKTSSGEGMRKTANDEGARAVDDSSVNEDGEKVSARENAAVIPVGNILVPMAEVENGEAFVGISVVGGGMADNGEVEVLAVTNEGANAFSDGVAEHRANGNVNLIPSAQITGQTDLKVVDNEVDKAAPFAQAEVEMPVDEASKGGDKISFAESDAKYLSDSVSAATSESGANSLLSAAVQLDGTVDAEALKKDSAGNVSEAENNEYARKGDSFAALNMQTKQVADVRQAEDEQVDVSKDKELEIQAAELTERLDGKSLQVKVDIKEEKIAYHNSRDLIKNSAVLDEMVAALDETDDNGLSLSGMLSPAQNATVANVSVPPAAAPSSMVGAIDENVTMNAVEVSKVSLSGNGTAHAAAGNVEYANMAKAEAASKSNETSFRDVFKGMGKEAVEQVKVNIIKSAVKGVDSINVRLKPAELGHIEVKMQIKDGKLHAQIISSRPETMEALQREAQVLEKAFNDAGFQTDENSLSFSWRNDGQQTGQNQSRENPLRSFIGEVFETEANSELLSAEAANQNWSAEKGLNIKV